MDKQKIIAELQRLSKDNGGKPIGSARFQQETGITKSDWYPDHWIRWGDVQREAGVAVGEFQSRTSDDFVITQYIGLVRELGRFPVSGELRRKSKQDDSFPSHQVFYRFGGKEKLIDAVAAYCQDKPEYRDISVLCGARLRSPAERTKLDKTKYATGCVYLVKSGRHYKIGRTNSIARRGSELAVTIPIPPKNIHVIETDDPSGVEAYWHRRFADKRGEGEWFELLPDDVKAFKRWKRIV